MADTDWTVWDTQLPPRSPELAQMGRKSRAEPFRPPAGPPAESSIKLLEAGLPKASFDQQGYDPNSALSRCHRYPFSVDTLIAAVNTGCSVQTIKAYLQSKSAAVVKMNINTASTQHHFAISYAVERNDPDILKLCLHYGASAKSIMVFNDIPLLAYAIMRSKWTANNATETVKLLLMGGAEVRSIPQDMWMEYVLRPKIKPTQTPREPSLKWCTPDCRTILVETLNLTMRYYLWLTSRMVETAPRKMQLMQLHSITQLDQLAYNIIGQELAVATIKQSLLAHIAKGAQDAAPLVMVFAGLSGHGKTELANQLGQLLSMETIDLDCTQMKRVDDLVGPASPYQGWEEGAPFNNFIARNTGRRCVVFLDEFDKTVREVREALLKIMDAGMYRDRRNYNDIDASKVIFVLATNLGDTKIDNFYSDFIATRKDSEISQVSLQSLQTQLLKLFVTTYSAAVAGRINAIVPFFPFSHDERAVIAHKFMLKLHDRLRRPIDLDEPVLNSVGHSYLQFIDDGKLCRHLGRTGYVKDLGARSIANAVDNSIGNKFLERFWLDGDETTEDLNQEPLMKFNVQLHPAAENKNELVVIRDGFAPTKAQGILDDE